MSDAPSSPRAPSPPPGAAALLGPALLELADAVRAAAARVAATAIARRSRPDPEGHDGEAIHDLRVAIRRLRTLLRPARAIYGKKRARAAAEDLRRFADAAGAVRDEEVLRETLAALPVAARARRPLDAWIAGRARRERGLRGAVARLLTQAPAGPLDPEAPPSLELTLGRLTARVASGKARDRDAGELAREALARAEEGVREQLGLAHATRDAAAMHALRIRYKRLRYTAEIFAPALGEGAHAIARAAAKMQKRLGELHDLDEAAARIGRARGLAAPVKASALWAIERARRALAKRLGEELEEAAKEPIGGVVSPATRDGAPGAATVPPKE